MGMDRSNDVSVGNLWNSFLNLFIHLAMPGLS